MMGYDEMDPSQYEEGDDDHEEDDEEEEEEEELSTSRYPINTDAVNEPRLFVQEGNIHIDRKGTRGDTYSNSPSFQFTAGDDEGERSVSPLHGIDPFA